MGALLTGLGIGIGAGVSPGPLLVLVITATLRGGWRHGALTALAPLASDLVVVTVVLVALSRAPASALSWLGVVGGLVVMAVGVQTLRESHRASLAVGEGEQVQGRQSFWRGVVVNLLSPHPWISWIAVLGPLTVRAWRQQPPSAVAVVLGFYVALVGSKVVLAVLVARGRRYLTDAGYRRAVALAGVALVVFGVLMLVEFARPLV